MGGKVSKAKGKKKKAAGGETTKAKAQEPKQVVNRPTGKEKLAPKVETTAVKAVINKETEKIKVPEKSESATTTSVDMPPDDGGAIETNQLMQSPPVDEASALPPRVTSPEAQLISEELPMELVGESDRDTSTEEFVKGKTTEKQSREEIQDYIETNVTQESQDSKESNLEESLNSEESNLYEKSLDSKEFKYEEAEHNLVPKDSELLRSEKGEERGDSTSDVAAVSKVTSDNPEVVKTLDLGKPQPPPNEEGLDSNVHLCNQSAN